MVYEYAVSVIILTFIRSSNVTFVKAGENGVTKGLGYTILTFFLGWWGIPWGPIRSVQAMITNFKGGKDVTERVVSVMKQTVNANKTAQ